MQPTEVSSKQVVQTALRGERLGRSPAGPLAVHYCAGLAGISLADYSTNAEALANSVIAYYEQFRPDAVWVSADTWVSAEAMGAPVQASGPNQPLGGSGEPLVSTAADIDRIPSPDISRGRYPVLLEALRRVVHRVGNEVFIVACFDQYPFSLAAALMGINEIMLKVHDDPAFVRALMERCIEYTTMYAKALSHAGADMLSGGDSPAGLLGPVLYEAIALPAEQRLLENLRGVCALPLSLHICGNSTKLLPTMTRSGADILEIDSAVDMAEAARVVSPKTVLWGNLDPVRLLLQGSPADVSHAAHQLLRAMSASGHTRFVLSSGCTFAVGTPRANVQALIEAAHTYSPGKTSG
jgi:MtaA/CmuA family methyltransferase